MQFLAEWAAAWDDWELEVEDHVDAGEHVVSLLNQRGRSKATGIPVEMRFAQVWTFRDGQAIGMQMSREPGRSPRSRGPVGVTAGGSDDCKSSR